MFTLFCGLLDPNFFVSKWVTRDTIEHVYTKLCNFMEVQTKSAKKSEKVGLLLNNYCFNDLGNDCRWHGTYLHKSASNESSGYTQSSRHLDSSGLAILVISSSVSNLGMFDRTGIMKLTSFRHRYKKIRKTFHLSMNGC